ncbi:acetyl-CoA C-acyltransferase [uncultured Veillonella sp.]|uniref:acetyl-CoA C-acyltransferase n=1 Tax=uncultured Veillonella sp. TaxID=159268 RepID=UPI00262EBD4E|nr:acetyl-CoA C-acyltransferase [uncultured Veillonella sp.]
MVKHNNFFSNVYIMGGLRTPIGVYKGQYKRIRPELLGAALLNELQRRGYGADEIICGNAVGTGGNIGRLMALYSNYDRAIPSYTVDMQCASGAMAIIQGVRAIQSGMASQIIAGGIESSSLQPLRVYADLDARRGNDLSHPKESVSAEYLVAQFSPDTVSPFAMLEGAHRTAIKHNMTKSDLDAWVLYSHSKALEGRNDEFLQQLIMGSDELKAELTNLGENDLLGYISHWGTADFKDESIKPRLTQNVLNRMRPILKDTDLLNGANTCYTHDGAAFLGLTKEPQEFRIVDVLTWAGDPQYSPEGAWHSTEAILKRNELTMDSIDAVEWNEAFAVIDVLFERAYKEHLHKYNQLGGALAYGHAYGASGAVNVLHLMAALQRTKGRYGVTSIAGAGGTGTAILIERV